MQENPSRWKPITLADLHALIEEQMTELDAAKRELFLRASFSPTKWQQSPWGDEGGGFWAIATVQDRVLWYNDIEDGFEVSRFAVVGRIPDDEYWANQDSLTWALPALAGEDIVRLGPPRPLPPGATE